MDFEFFRTTDPKSPAAKLLAIGKATIPYLIDELDNVEFTRSLSPSITTKEVIPAIHVLRVGDCVAGILRQITGQPFGDSWYIHEPTARLSPIEVREQAKRWWEKNKGNFK